MVVHRRGAMFDIAKIASRQPLPTGPRVQLITNSATLAQQMATTAEAVGLLLEPEPLILRHRREAPTSSTPRPAQALADDRCDSVVCAAVSSSYGRRPTPSSAALEALAAHADEAAVGVLLDFHGPIADERRARRDGELPTFDSPGDAIHALGGADRVRPLARARPGAVPLLDVDELAAKRLVNRVLAQHPRAASSPRTSRPSCSGRTASSWSPRPRCAASSEAIAVAERARLERGAEGDRAGRVRARPDQASVLPQHRRRRGDDARLGRTSATLVGELGLGRTQALAAAAPVVQKMAPPGVALVITQPGGRGVRPDRVARSGRASPASCSATSSTGCRR